MADIKLTVTLVAPDGEEDSVLSEFATGRGWDGVTGTAVEYLQKDAAEILVRYYAKAKMESARTTALQKVTVKE